MELRDLWWYTKFGKGIFFLLHFLFSPYGLLVQLSSDAKSKYTRFSALEMVIVTLTGYGSLCFPSLSVDKVYIQTFKGLSSPQYVHCDHQQWWMPWACADRRNRPLFNVNLNSLSQDIVGVIKHKVQMCFSSSTFWKLFIYITKDPHPCSVSLSTVFINILVMTYWAVQSAQSALLITAVASGHHSAMVVILLWGRRETRDGVQAQKKAKAPPSPVWQPWAAGVWLAGGSLGTCLPSVVGWLREAPR